MMLTVKICPSCRAEYQPVAERCSDCDVGLVHPEPATSALLPPARDLSALVRCDPWEATRIAQALQEAGIPSRIDSYPPGEAISAGDFVYGGRGGRDVEVCVYVTEADRVRADAVLDRFRARTLPDAPDSDLAAGESEHCPACGSAIPEAGTACADCGLGLPDVEYECNRCGAEVTSADARCPQCGVHFEDDEAPGVP